jgi:predicted CopG family antitoxin
MASKTISVTEDVYNLLKSLKLPHESFGDVIKRLCEEKLGSHLLQWLKTQDLWSDMSDEEFNSFKEIMSDATLTLHKVDL